MVRTRLVSTALAASALLATACFSDDPADPSEQNPDDPGPPPPPPVSAEGAYTVDSTIDIEVANVVPVQLYDGIELLRGLRDAPGRTLFDLAEDAGVPAVGTVRDALPSSLESKVYGWIDDHVGKVTRGTGPLAEGIDVALEAAETVLTQVEVASELEVAGAVASHRLREAGFAVAGADVRIDLAALGAIPFAIEAAPTASVSTTGGVSILALGEHSFGLPLGTLAFMAVEDSLRARYGTDLRGLLGQVVDCPAMAATVSDKCALGVCVGHETELRQICEEGLDYLAEEIEGRFTALDVEVLAFRAGRATLVDAGGDGRADALTGGVWTAEIDAGAGLRPAPASFVGIRR